MVAKAFGFTRARSVRLGVASHTSKVEASVPRDFTRASSPPALSSNTILIAIRCLRSCVSEEASSWPRARCSHVMISCIAVRPEKQPPINTGLPLSLWERGTNIFCPRAQKCQLNAILHLSHMPDTSKQATNALPRNASPKQHRLDCYPLTLRMRRGTKHAFAKDATRGALRVAPQHWPMLHFDFAP